MEVEGAYTIRPARGDEAAAISSLALRSKAYWPYTDEQLEIFRAELTLSAHDLERGRSHVVEHRDTPVGFYTLGELSPTRIELDHLFIDPEHLRRKLGHALFEHATALARACGFREMVIQSDPNAAGFYRELGAAFVRDTPSSIPGRTLPLCHYALS